jgi:hypothetical protein
VPKGRAAGCGCLPLPGGLEAYACGPAGAVDRPAHDPAAGPEGPRHQCCCLRLPLPLSTHGCRCPQACVLPEAADAHPSLHAGVARDPYCVCRQAPTACMNDCCPWHSCSSCRNHSNPDNRRNRQQQDNCERGAPRAGAAGGHGQTTAAASSSSGAQTARCAAGASRCSFGRAPCRGLVALRAARRVCRPPRESLRSKAQSRFPRRRSPRPVFALSPPLSTSAVQERQLPGRRPLRHRGRAAVRPGRADGQRFQGRRRVQRRRGPHRRRRRGVTAPSRP